MFASCRYKDSEWQRRPSDKWCKAIMQNFKVIENVQKLAEHGHFM